MVETRKGANFLLKALLGRLALGELQDFDDHLAIVEAAVERGIDASESAFAEQAAKFVTFADDGFPVEKRGRSRGGAFHAGEGALEDGGIGGGGIEEGGRRIARCEQRFQLPGERRIAFTYAGHELLQLVWGSASARSKESRNSRQSSGVMNEPFRDVCACARWRAFVRRRKMLRRADRRQQRPRGDWLGQPTDRRATPKRRPGAVGKRPGGGR